MLFRSALKAHISCAKRLFSVARVRYNVVPAFVQASKYGDAVAIADQHGNHTYAQVFSRASQLAERILAECGLAKGGSGKPEAFLGALRNQRIAVLCSNDAQFTVASFAVWMLGGCIVPLYKAHPERMHQYYVDDSQVTLLLTTQENAEKARKIDVGKLGAKVLLIDQGAVAKKSDYSLHQRWLNEAAQNDVFREQPAVIIYTSGTTANPKGAVLSHGNLHANVTDMVNAWKFTKDDVLLHVLPLNHVHGLVNALLTPLHVGACTLMLPAFDEQAVWKALLKTHKALPQQRVSVFTAVPTIYKRLIDNYEAEGDEQSRVRRVREACNRVRMMISGSAPLPVSLSARWRAITGHRLLERYGMTETGMILTQPYVPHGECSESSNLPIPGTVGTPFNSVQIRIVGKPVEARGEQPPFEVLAEADHTGIRVKSSCGESGELLVRGAGVFNGYLNKEQQTRESFVSGGWFRTGDSARVELDAAGRPAAVRLLGRLSSDIIKSGAVKVSALEIEQRLLEHPRISECAVVGLDDDTWGQKVAVAVVLRNDNAKPQQLALTELISWCKQQQLPPEHIPRAVKVLDALPKNHMGKVTKKQIVKEWSSSGKNY